MNCFIKKDFAYFEKEIVKQGFSLVGRVQVNNEPDLKKVTGFEYRFKNDEPWRTFVPIKRLFKIGRIDYRLVFKPKVDLCLAYNKKTNEYFLYIRT